MVARQHASIVGLCATLAILTFLVSPSTADESPQPSVGLALDLVDGSRVIGVTRIKTIPLRTSYANMDVPLNQVLHIGMEDDHETAVLQMRNGDRLQGVLNVGPVGLETVFGSVTVPIPQIVRIEIRLPDDETGALRSGLMLHYSFDRDDGDKITDMSGQDNHGKNFGAIGTPEGKRLNALLLNGTSAYVDMGAGSIVSLPAWDEYSISVWFLNDGKGDHGRGYGQKILDKTVMYHDFYLCVLPEGGLHFAATEPERPSGLTDDTHDYRDGKWHHAVVVKKGAHGELWVDGALKASADNLQQVQNEAPLLIGYSKSSDAYQRKFWSGRVDELKLFKKALSKPDILRLFQKP